MLPSRLAFRAAQDTVATGKGYKRTYRSAMRLRCGFFVKLKGLRGNSSSKPSLGG